MLRTGIGSGLAAAACIIVLAGCGGSSSVTSGSPPPDGPVVGGTVSMPNGEVAAAPSMLDRFAAAVISRVEALVGTNIRTVGAGVTVRLMRIGDRNIVDGEIRNATLVFEALTDSKGAYSVRLQTDTTVDTCRYYVEVGSSTGRTRTRAFVYSDRTDIDFQSEATVRLLLDEMKKGTTTLCDLSSSEIKHVNDAVVASQGQVFGDTASAVNSSAVVVAGADPDVRAAIAVAVEAFTPTPNATNTAPVTATGSATATATVAVPTATGVAPTRTGTNTRRPPTRTAVPTDTEPPPSRTPTSIATATNTVVGPTATSPVATATPVPSNTPMATNTALVATNTPAPTNTAVRSPTVAATVTATAPTANVEVGIAAGTAGGLVSVPVSLMTNGAAIAAVSTDIEFDAALVDIAQVAGTVACTVDARLAGQKAVFQRVSALSGTQKRLRVGLIGTTNNTPISDGPLFACRFVIDDAADGSVVLRNQPAAAGPQGQEVTALGVDGRVDVVQEPAILALSAGTAAAGGMTMISAALHPNGQALAAVATDIHFDPAALAVGGNDEPDCTLEPAIAARGKTLVAMQLPDSGGKALLRVGIIGSANNTALSDGGNELPLFECRFTVQPAASGTITLSHSPEGAAPDALPVGLTSQPGSITVQ